MPGLCPAPDIDDPLVSGLLSLVDCNVQGLVRGGYSTLFEPGGAFTTVLTSLLTIYIAIIGFQLLLGRTQLRIGDFAIIAVKIGAVLALASGWETYQAVVYNFLFHGPAQMADAMLAGVQPRGSAFRGDVFDGLQVVFDTLNAMAKAWGGQQNAAAALTTGTPGAGAATSSFGPQALTISAMTLLLSSLGVVLAAKVVMGLLLAVGPIFIALLMFETTRGLFEGWLRASIACAFAATAAILLLGVALTALEGPLLRLRDQLAQGDFTTTAGVYTILILVIVFAAVAVGAVLSGAIIAIGFRIPTHHAPMSALAGRDGVDAMAISPGYASRAGRIAAAAAAMDRRDPAPANRALSSGEDRRTAIAVTTLNARTDRASGVSAPEMRLGQGPRRGAAPKARRVDARSVR